MDTIRGLSAWDLLRQQRAGVCAGGLLVLIGGLCSLAVLYPQDTLAAFGGDEQKGLFPLLLLATFAAGACLLGAGWWIVGWLFRQGQGFRRLGAATQATVATEFLLAIPVLMILFGTVFQIGEIAHAQLAFRYAAFSVARAGSVSNSLLPWPPRIKTNADGILMIFFIADDDKARMKAAAAAAMSGIDTYKFTDNRADAPTNAVCWREDPANPGSTLKKEDFDPAGLAFHYEQAGTLRLVRKTTRNPWDNRKDLFRRQFRDANAAIVDFDPECAYAPLLDPQFVTELTNQIADALGVDDVASGGGPLAMLLDAVGINPDEMIRSVINGLLTKVLDATGLRGFLESIPNPLAPPMISVEMTYELRMRPASLFYWITSKGQNGYRCLNLQRTSNYKTRAPLLMQTTGGRIDLPVVPPLFLYVNLFPGENSFKMKE